MIFKAISTTISTNRSRLIMSYRHNCHKVRSIFSFIVSIALIMSTKAKTFYVNVTLINWLYKRRNIWTTCSHVFLKLLFIIEQEFHHNANFKRSQHENYTLSHIRITCSHVFLKFLFIIEQKFHHYARLEICWETFHNVFLERVI